MNVSAANLVGIIGITRRLVQDGALSEADARAAQAEAAKAKRPIQKYLVEKNLVNSVQLATAFSLEFGLPLFDLSAMDLNQSLASLIPEELANKQQMLPLQRHGGKLFVAIADPTNSDALDAAKFASNSIVEPVVVAEDALRKALELAYNNPADTLDDSGDDELVNLEAVGGDDDLRASLFIGGGGFVELADDAGEGIRIRIGGAEIHQPLHPHAVDRREFRFQPVALQVLDNARGEFLVDRHQRKIGAHHGQAPASSLVLH